MSNLAAPRMTLVPPAFIGSEIYRLEVFAPPHPLAMPRAMLVRDLCAALGWLAERQYFEAAMATDAELCAFHDADYIAALHRAEHDSALPPAVAARTRIGLDGNVIHKAVFRRPAISVGGALLAAGMLAGGVPVYAPGVGNHHGRRAQASGFCFVNDIALAIIRLRALGIKRIAYVDLDAHHGDGVETAFADDPDVLTLSVHESGRWPRSGGQSDPARAIYNFPVPPGFNDSEMNFLLAHAISPLVRNFQPEALLILPGADALADDSMSRLMLSNNAIWDAVRLLRSLAPRVAVFGGGGYNPFALARCWAGIFGILNGFPLPDTLPYAAQALLRDLVYHRHGNRALPGHWVQTLRDPPNPGGLRDEVLAMEVS
ncbi:MAG: acetoin utilization protein AcuC [Acidocella sp.]|nr:acetoin utilization protein AcuC [Acidocella sp.]